MHDEEEISQVSIIFAALSNPIRLRILSLVSETKRPLHIKAVAKILKKDYAAVYRHIDVLKRANLLQIFEVGRSRVLSPLHVETVKQLIQHASKIAE
ncbi:MAG: winged helix-turn-helix domain-containing protein [Candidatus Bathyarchaeota archaeon]